MTITTKFEPGDLVWYISNDGISCCAIGIVKVHEFSSLNTPSVSYAVYDHDGDLIWANENGLHPSLASLMRELQRQGDIIMGEDWYIDAIRKQANKGQETIKIEQIEVVLGTNLDPLGDMPI